MATTRPETMVGDVAIAVHPQDPRYTHLHGKYAIHPFIPDRKLLIVTDDILVDMELGTGAVKITPAHDPNDFACGERHNLPFINIMNDDGTLNDNAGPFKGMKRYHARNAVIKALQEKGLYVGAEDNPMSLSFCAKSGDVIEPLMKPQWWVKVAPMAEKAIEVRGRFEAVFRFLLMSSMHSEHVRASSSSGPPRPKMTGTDGCQPLRTGAYPVSCGGDTAVLLIMFSWKAAQRMKKATNGSSQERKKRLRSKRKRSLADRSTS